MELDRIETIGGTVIQHGPFSNRVYLMKLDASDFPGIIERIDELALQRGYTKAFAKAPVSAETEFESAGYRREALIRGFYSGREDAVLLGKYYEAKRERVENADQLAEVLEIARLRAGDCKTVESLEGIAVVRCGPGDVEQMSRLYREVFESYPFPITDPAYLRQTMESHIEYFGAVEAGRFVALSSAEMDREAMNVEMTDFATLAEFRGRGLARRLLRAMEEAMGDRDMRVAYTIARAISAGMNVVFAQRGYHYGGTLANNTQIAGSIESMNVWWKRLR